MTPANLTRDVATLREALSTDSPEVNVTLSREVAQLLADAAEAEADGRLVIARRFNEVSTAEAARLLGMSRPQMSKLINMGRLASRLVGSHHRISVEEIHAFQERERVRRKEGLRRIAALQNNLGLDD